MYEILSEQTNSVAINFHNDFYVSQGKYWKKLLDEL